MDWLPQGRRLVTIKTDCDLADYIDGLPAMDSIAYGEQDTGALKGFYEKFGFKGLARALDGAAAEPAPPAKADKASKADKTPKAATANPAEPGLFDEPAAVAANTTATAITIPRFIFVESVFILEAGVVVRSFFISFTTLA